MEKKTTNTYNGISKSVLKSLNKNFISEPLKDENRISEIISEFITGELNTINLRLNSGEILNFKDQTNQTLIHAILRNESPNIREENKLEIIQKLVSDKNVSLHTMTNYNQNPLHLACQKGYSIIINYLIDKGCDQTLIDNYGNTPVHYLIDKFISSCEDNEFYSHSNKQIKSANTSELKKINNILKNESLLTMFNLLEKQKKDSDSSGGPSGPSGPISSAGPSGSDEYYCEEVGESGYRIINAIKKFIANKVQSSLPTINKLIEKKIKDIDDIFVSINEGNEIKFEKAKNIVFSISNDIFQIYGLDMEFKNIMWDNFLNEQNLRIRNKKAELEKKIFEIIEQIKNSIQINITHKINEMFAEAIYSHLSKFSSGVVFLYYFISNFINEDNVDGNNIAFIYNDADGELHYITGDAGNSIYLKMDDTDNDQKCAYDNIYKILSNIRGELFKKDFHVFLNGMNNINNLDTIDTYECFFSDTHKYPYKFCYDKVNKYCRDYINIVGGLDASSNYVFYIPNELNYDGKTNNNYRVLMNNLKGYDINTDLDENFIRIDIEEEESFIYSPIRIIMDYIDHICEIINLRLDNLLTNDRKKFASSIQEFFLFDIKYLGENIFKIINNLVILEKYLNDIDIEEIDGLNKLYKEVYEKFSTTNELDGDFKIIMGKFDFFIKQTSISDSENIINNFKEKTYTETFDFLYDANTNILDKLKELTSNINEYFSYDQLEKYNELLIENIKSSGKTIQISNTIFNNYQFDLKYSPKYKEYKEKYFKINEEYNLYEKGIISGTTHGTIPETPKDFIINKNYKKDFIKNNWNYANTNDFNIFYLNTTKSTSTSDYDYKIEFICPDISDNDINDITDSTKIIHFKNFDLYRFEYNLKFYEFALDEFKFSRGYDILKYDTDKKLNKLNITDEKNENKMLCDMKFIGKNSDYDSANNSVSENTDKIVSWKIENTDKFLIKNIDEIESYIITNNLGELINMLVYVIYEKIFNEKISDAFFKETTLNFINSSGAKFNSDIGVKLSKYDDKLDKVSKKNIEDTLGFIRVNPVKRQEYLYDNIKSFVKIIIYEEINKQIFKIMNEIKITNLSADKTSVEKQQIIEPSIINKFNKGLSQIENKYRKNFWSNQLAEYMKNLPTSPVLEFQEILNLSKDNSSSPSSSTQTKIIDSKCLNKNKTDELMKIPMDYKVLDSNGNTILIRLIEQYNIYGVKKLIENNKQVLFTYKNNNMETPLDYLVNLEKNIHLDYSDANFKNRMERYSLALENSIKSSNQFDGIELSNSYNLLTQSIINSIFLFNETMWLKIYSYPSGWTIADKNRLKSLLKINKEELLINSFDSTDLNKYIEDIKSNSKSNMSNHIKILEDEVAELKNRSKELGEETENEFIAKQSGYNISNNINQLNSEIATKEEIIKNYYSFIEKNNKESYKTLTDTITITMSNYKNKLLDMDNLAINWVEYNNLVSDLDYKYLSIIKILNDKCEKNNNSISNHLIKIYCLDMDNKESFDLIKKYFSSIYTKVFNDYWDLDRYENSEYNITNKSIIQILKINIIGIIKNEFVNTLANYIIQLNTNANANTNANTNDTNEIIKHIKTNNDLKKSIQIYLYECMVSKLKLNNPDRNNLEINIDEQKLTIIRILEKILGSVFDETEQIELKKIIEFNKFICENICLNCYEEIIKILQDGKKISIYYELYDLISKEVNTIK
jgi:hypothetical protein